MICRLVVFLALSSGIEVNMVLFKNSHPNCLLINLMLKLLSKVIELFFQYCKIRTIMLNFELKTQTVFYADSI